MPQKPSTPKSTTPPPADDLELDLAKAEAALAGGSGAKGDFLFGAPPKSTNAHGTFQQFRLPTIDEMGNAVTNFVIGSAKGTGQTLMDLAKFQSAPGSFGQVTPFDVAKKAWEPEGWAQTAGSFAPDLAMGYGIKRATQGAAGRLAEGATRSWMDATGRPLSESPKSLAIPALEEGVGGLGRKNAVRQAEILAGKQPTGKERAKAFQSVERGYRQAGMGQPVRVFDIPIPFTRRLFNPANVAANVAGKVYSASGAVPPGLGAMGALGSAAYREAIMRLISEQEDGKPDRNE